MILHKATELYNVLSSTPVTVYANCHWESTTTTDLFAARADDKFMRDQYPEQILGDCTLKQAEAFAELLPQRKTSLHSLHFQWNVYSKTMQHV